MDFRPIAVILGVVLPISLPVAAPFLPQHDGQVLERLPARRDDPAMAELRQLRERLPAAPRNSQAPPPPPQRYFELARADGDPRYVGHPEAAPRPRKDGGPPAEE